MTMVIVDERIMVELAAWKSVMRRLIGERAFAAVENRVRAEMNDPFLLN